jgi:hypothetical protein
MPLVDNRRLIDEEDEEPIEELVHVDLAGRLRRTVEKRLSVPEKEYLQEQADRRLRDVTEDLRDQNLHSLLRKGRMPRGRAFREEWR